MIVKFFSANSKASKYSTGGDGVQDYLLGDDYKNGNTPSRENAALLRGDPNLTTEIINSLDFSTPYCSGCLSFDSHESERLTPELKEKLMLEFEQTLFPDFVERVPAYWVEHTDKIDPNSGKPRVELNFVFANVDLVSDKFLPSYFAAADQYRVNAWKDIANFKYDLSDPNDPRRAVSTRVNNRTPAKLKDLKSSIDDQIAAGVNSGEIKNRADVAAFLVQNGYEIVKQKSGSISLKNPDPNNVRNVRLEGAFYEKNFNAAEYLKNREQADSIPQPDDVGYEQYKATKSSLIAEREKEYSYGIEKRKEFLLKRYPEPTPAPPILNLTLTAQEIKHYEYNYRSAFKVIESANTDNSTATPADSSVRAGTGTSARATETAALERAITSTQSRIADTEQRIAETKQFIASVNIRLEQDKIVTFTPPRPQPTPPKMIQPEQKKATKAELWRNPAMRSPADLFRFKLNLIDEQTANTEPRRDNIERLYNNVLELPDLKKVFDGYEQGQKKAAYGVYFDFDTIPVKRLDIEVHPKAMPILVFVASQMTKNPEIMKNYTTGTTAEFLEKYASQIKDLDPKALDDIIEHYAKKYPDTREGIEPTTPEPVARPTAAVAELDERNEPNRNTFKP